MHTIDDYKAAKAASERLNQQWGNYTGNKPDKYRASIAAAAARVRSIEAELKALGLIDRTPQEELEHRLDSTFPNARSKQVVEVEGRRCVLRFTPLGKSLSGKTVTEWGKSWEEVPR